MNRSKWSIINLLALIQMIVMNALANILPINGRQTGEISDELGLLFTPAGYVFSIWGLIYVLLTLWVLRGLFVKKREEIQVIDAIGPFFLINAILNSSWILLFHYGYYEWTLPVISAMLITLIIISRKIVRSEGARQLNRFPFSIYMGWVSVATILNVGVAYRGFSDLDAWVLSGELWTNLLLVIGLLLAAFLSRLMRDYVYPLVFVWAFVGIYAARAAEYPVIGAVALITGFSLLMIVLYGIWKNRALYPAKSVET
ncbi:tryptophan-rich sensory protein [Salisediminibacterium beveridgei]|uniref:Tryptophan-rich sensory protein n=1 Tax=Salisediminibacterium beveridgei TaxID=632773 RepID=A0A1D7QXM8_9BACI|nr:tryptophan-rich sensory protein [Salisediminibacterium beveridgei]AOM83708.1 hypothetical protein BBEV_2367 [Salisediminibacterium beveridgei]